MTKNETAFPLGDLLDGGSTLDLVDVNADNLARAFDNHILRNLAPDRNKKLRSFTPAETAELLGITPGNLRKLRSDGRVPDLSGEALPGAGAEDPSAGEAAETAPDAKGGRKVKIYNYTAQEILEVRKSLAKGARNPLQFLPGRTGKEPLLTVAFSTHKGGSGKTTSAVTLAQRFALLGYRVLLCDLDPQASASTMMGLRRDFDLAEDDTIYEVLRYDQRKSMAEIARPTYFPNLDLAAAGSVLQEFETETATALQGEGRDVEPFFTRLASAIRSVEHKYDLVFIDCPPQLGFLTMTALSAATAVVVPVIPNMIDVASLKQYLLMLSAYLRVIGNKGAGFDYHFLRYLLCRYEPTDGPQTQVSGFLRSVFPGQVMTNPFLKSTAIADAGITSDTIYEVPKGQLNRATLGRALESVNLVADELEQQIHRAWGRKV